jgi:hypothetical protein
LAIVALHQQLIVEAEIEAAAHAVLHVGEALARLGVDILALE